MKDKDLRNLLDFKEGRDLWGDNIIRINTVKRSQLDSTNNWVKELNNKIDSLYKHLGLKYIDRECKTNIVRKKKK